MKLLLCFFSLYILVLAGIPCRPDDDCCMDEIAANAARPQSEKQSGSREYPGPCSPFFACGACHGFVVPEPMPPVPAEQPMQLEQQAIYKGQPLPDFSPSIWQPPQLG
jgi:hypothetical protein